MPTSPITSLPDDPEPTSGQEEHDPPVDAAVVVYEPGICPICREAWDAHNLPRARACQRTLEEALALAERRKLKASHRKRRTADGILRIAGSLERQT